MIPRYSRLEMTKIWEPENRFRIWFEIEAHACDALAELGVVPKEAAKEVWAKGKWEIARIDEIERETKHDVIAFLTNLAEHVGPAARFVHQGMTSSDVLDTCLAVQMKQASDILLKDLDQLLAALKKRALEHKMTPTIGRSHAIHAEPTTFGLKLAGHYAAFDRAKKRLIAARDEIATCAISGAVGTFANIDPKVEAHVAAKLGLKIEPVSTQVIPRDRHAMFFATLGVIASSIENLAIEIRHLQRSEMREAEEHFSPGQKGSSAMPHKRNPVLTENLTGLARIVRAAVTPALENVALWHERDISHSAVERVFGPDATIALDFALARLAGVVEKLIVYPEAMAKNLETYGGLVHSQRVLLALTQAGVSREDSYKLVQRNAMKVWLEGKDFLAELKSDPEVTAKLKPAQIEECFDLGYHTKHVDTIFARKSSDKASITLEEAFAWCRAHPVENVDLERFLGIFTTDARRIIDARDHGLIGLIMDRLTIQDGAKPFEWIGAAVDKIDPQVFPILIERLRSTARLFGIPAIDMTLSGHWASVRDELARAGARPKFVDIELTHADCNWGPDRPLPQGWHWELVTPEREAAYIALLNRGMGPMPGVYVPPEPEALASMRTTADGTKLLLDTDGEAQAMVRCKLAKRYLHLVCCTPEKKGRGLGRLALDEVRRMLGPGPLHLTVVKQNERAHGFYLHMGFAPTEEVETWRLPIAS